MKKMVNDYLAERENLMEECRSDFKNLSPDMLDEMDSNIRRSVTTLTKLISHLFRSFFEKPGILDLTCI